MRSNLQPIVGSISSFYHQMATGKNRFSLLLQNLQSLGRFCMDCKFQLKVSISISTEQREKQLKIILVNFCNTKCKYFCIFIKQRESCRLIKLSCLVVSQKLLLCSSFYIISFLHFYYIQYDYYSRFLFQTQLRLGPPAPSSLLLFGFCQNIKSCFLYIMTKVNKTRIGP